MNFCCGSTGAPAPNPVVLATRKGITRSSAAERFILSRRDFFCIEHKGYRRSQ
jgi:hypothetical protein